MSADTYQAPEHGWTCFHCGETFTTVGGARDHFGTDRWYEPGCILKVELGSERGWLIELRRVQADRDRHMNDSFAKEAELTHLRGELDAERANFQQQIALHVRDHTGLTEKLATAERERGPWRLVKSDDILWMCSECGHQVSRGMYPTHLGHANTCSYSAYPILKHVEEAERLRNEALAAVERARKAKEEEK